MKTNFFVSNRFIAIIFLITHANIWNMFPRQYIYIGEETSSVIQNQENIIKLLFNKSDSKNNKHDNEEDKQHSIIATAHNHNNTFLKLPNEIFYFILDHSIDTTKPLKDIIKPALLLSTTCKKFNTEQSLITTGTACKCYSLEEKNKAMKMLLKSMHDLNYPNRRHAALFLTYAGAQNDAYEDSLLEDATLKSDQQMIIALFENNTNPNQKNGNEPICFMIKKLPIAQIFIKYGANLNIQSNNFNPNILFACLCYDCSSELIEFYINNKVDVTIKRYNNSNLLHTLAIKDPDAYHLNDYIKIGTLFIKAAPDLLNKLNNDGETPLNIAQQQLKNNPSKNIMVALIKLFEEHGGKTAEQLKQDAIKTLEPIIQSTETNPSCCICYGLFENPESIRNIPCKQKHPDKICLSCYKSCLKFSDKCPLCRGTL